ncbi:MULTISPECIES: YwmB family TATA-box binding protein [Cytobacillus]|uniref:YwmB family TATA-box binding protein n=1 Tax=Cytobacillus TaxID=2675230 RepID=UPI001CD79FA0|nr:YwmB family TATA-box binding protein [Cytobacillus kochii]MCA1026332.1 YwmB family TATA-box binding protein [Cytobacillus kochii]MCM3322522.1 YwmB family TATA-box binding protein [Cytobacillus kochii]MCM3345000.1 YwmB family TATA-box binding protein [Cytobacillus kochii]MDM5209555.1 YwmB family TATA-box binding protein [Cytobacillus kochii]
MKKYSFIFSIMGIVGLVWIIFGNHSDAASVEELSLIQIAQTVQDENILIQEWSVHARENLETLQTFAEVKAYTKEMKKSFTDWKWSVQKESQERYEVIGTLKKNDLTETIKILSTDTKNNVQTYVIYEAKGAGYKGSIQENMGNYMKSQMSDIFTKKPNIFSCIIGHYDGNMRESMLEQMNGLLSTFNAKEIEALEEEQFISTSAYSPMFKESVTTDGKDMNLQIGLRKEGLGAKTTIVIGTPIITIEY